MARRLFAAGSIVLIATGLLHLLGHYALVTSEAQAATVSAGVFGIMTVVAFRYWFPVPLGLIAAAFLCFAAATAAGRTRA